MHFFASHVSDYSELYINHILAYHVDITGQCFSYLTGSNEPYVLVYSGVFFSSAKSLAFNPSRCVKCLCPLCTLWYLPLTSIFCGDIGAGRRNHLCSGGMKAFNAHRSAECQRLYTRMYCMMTVEFRLAIGQTCKYLQSSDAGDILLKILCDRIALNRHFGKTFCNNKM